MSILRRYSPGRNESDQLRREADAWRQRAQDEARWGNADLSDLRSREYRGRADRLDHAAGNSRSGEEGNR